MIKAVVDTNVFVSGLLSGTGAPAKLILRWLKGQFDFKSFQDVRIVTISKFLTELEKHFSE